jgi:hypothetical protein
VSTMSLLFRVFITEVVVIVVVKVVVMVVLFFFKEMKRSRARALRFVFVWAKFLLSLSYYYVDMGEDRNVKRIVNVPKEFSSLSP